MSRGPRRLRKPDVAVLEGVLMADSLVVGRCDCCGDVHIKLIDRSDKVFAVAVVPREGALALADDLLDNATAEPAPAGHRHH
jgi:hypothetical protein